MAVVQPAPAVPEFDGGVLGGREEEVFFLRVPVDAIDRARVGRNDPFLGRPAIAGEVPQDDVPIASAAGQDISRGVFQAPFDVIDGKIDFTRDLAR